MKIKSMHFKSSYMKSYNEEHNLAKLSLGIRKKKMLGTAEIDGCKYILNYFQVFL